MTDHVVDALVVPAAADITPIPPDERLKVDDEVLPVGAIARREEVRVGQWRTVRTKRGPHLCLCEMSEAGTWYAKVFLNPVKGAQYIGASSDLSVDEAIRLAVEQLEANPSER